MFSPSSCRWASVRGHGVFKTPYRYRDYWRGLRTYDTTFAGGSAGSTNGGWFTTSTYDAGTPGLRKLWRKIAIDYTLPSANTQIVVEYSTNNGTTWTALTPVTTVGSRLRAEFFLQNVISTSFKLRVTLRSTVGSETPTFWGFAVSYLPVPEPNWLWTFTIVLNEQQELVDGSIATVDTATELAFLRDSYRTKQLLTYIDVDGSLWASAGQPGVLIYDIEFRIPDPSSLPLEGEVVVTLLEAVETY